MLAYSLGEIIKQMKNKNGVNINLKKEITNVESMIFRRIPGGLSPLSGGCDLPRKCPGLILRFILPSPGDCCVGWLS